MKAAEEGKANKIKIGSECMDIKRHVYQTLLKWKNDNCHTTLEVNGARQVGKTYIINKFADENFSHKVYINLFELSGEQFLSCYQKACDWQPGEGPRPQAPLHDAFRLFDENFSDTEDTVIIIDEIQESAILEESMNRNFGIQVGMLQVFKSIPYHMKNFWKQRIRIYLKNISCLEKNWIQ